MANASIDGLVSGMDTTSIISQLMQLERQPQLRLTAKRDQAKAVLAIYQTLNTRFEALRSAGLSLAKPADWKVNQATSSAPGNVTVTAGSSALPGNFSFSVQQLAKGGIVASSSTAASTATVVASGNFLVSKGANALGFTSLGAGDDLTTGSHTVEVTATGTVRVDGGPEIDVSGLGPGPVALAGPNGSIMATFPGPLTAGTTTVTNVATGNGSLAAVVDAVNGANAGVTAVAVKVGTDAYRLQISSTTTGSGSDITSGIEHLAGLGSFGTVQTGQDAVIRVGDGPGSYDVSSSSNTVADVLPGVTLQLLKADPALSVAVDVARDSGALATKVEALVQAANDALSYIKSNAGYDPSTKKAGALLSDSLARNLQQQVISAVSNQVAGSPLGSAGAVGISVARDGKLSFDKAKFTAAYAGNPEAVEAMFMQTGSATDASVSFLGASPKTQAGTYAVEITSGPPAVAGTIGGQPATYANGVLSSAATSGPTMGLAVRLAATDVGSYGDVTYTPGVAQRLNSVGAMAVESVTGSIKSASASRESAIRNFEDEISAWDVRLARREMLLRRQFSTLETALGNLRNQSNWLAGQLGSLSANNGS